MSQQNRFFIRRFRNLAIGFLCPTVVIFILAFVMEYQNANREMQARSIESVTRIEENMNSVVGNIFMQNEYLTNMAMMSSMLKRVLNNEQINYGDAINLRNLQAMLISMKNSYEYVMSTIVYFDDCDRYIVSDYAIQTVNGNEELRKIYLDMEPGQRSTVSVNMDSGQRVITFCQRLFTHDGCLITNIDLNRLQKMLQSYSYMKDEVIYLLDDEKHVLIQSEADTVGVQDFLSCLAEEKGAFQGQGSRWVRHSLFKRHLVSVRLIGEPGIYIVSITPDNTVYTHLLQTFKWFFVVCLLDILVILTLAFMTTKRSFDHIRSILWMFEQAEAGRTVGRPKTKTAQKDEYDIILDNMVQMFLNSSYLNMQLKEKQYEKENAELKALQLQINPHFLFNTLQTLDLEVGKEGKPEDIRYIIRCLSDILKYALEDVNKLVTLKEELSYLKKYMTVQQYRFGTRFIIYYDIEEELENAMVFRMMLQPVLENCLLHGIRQQTEEREYIMVEANMKQDKMEIIVSDTGKGMDEEQLRKLREQVAGSQSKSIGLANLNRRLLLYYGEESQLKIQSAVGEGTVISFSIPNVPL